MQASIRELKAHLSEYIRQVEAGGTVTVSIHNRPVAQIVPLPRHDDLSDLAKQPGISWNGGKPTGLPRGEVMTEGAALADWVIEDRR